MKILYIAKHGPHDNQDEDAIAYALRQIGHQVTTISENMGHTYTHLQHDYDFMLFHKWNNISAIKKYQIPKCFWYFDMIESMDPALRERSKIRVEWMRQVVPHCTLGFCTDGDWVLKDTTNKLYHLMQGTDERYTGLGSSDRSPIKPQFIPPLLFLGTVTHGSERVQQVQELSRKYGDKFGVIGDGGPRSRYHGRDLANLLAATKISISPKGPSTDHYWSNRVYLTLGLGGFLLHPYCEELRHHYSPEELIMYEGSSNLDRLISYFLDNEEDRLEMIHKGYGKTVACHLYRHRCYILARLMQEHING